MKVDAFLLALVSATVIISCSGHRLTPQQLKYGLVSPVSRFDIHASGFEPDHSVFFNRKGMVDSIVYYDDESAVRYTERYAYDDEGNVKMFEDVTPDGNVGSSCIYEYEDGFIVHAGMISMGGQEVITWRHRHDSKNIVHTDYYEEGVLISSTDYAYDGNRCHEVSADTSGNVLGEADYVYWKEKMPSSIKSDDVDVRIEYCSDNDLPVRSFNVVLSSDGLFVPVPDGYDDKWLEYHYEYDADGNWTRRAVTLDGGDDELSVIYRDIYK